MDIDDVSDQFVPWVKFGIDQLLDSARRSCPDRLQTCVVDLLTCFAWSKAVSRSAAPE